jgi:hypothetical protein
VEYAVRASLTPAVSVLLLLSVSLSERRVGFEVLWLAFTRIQETQRMLYGQWMASMAG